MKNILLLMLCSLMAIAKEREMIYVIPVKKMTDGSKHYVLAHQVVALYNPLTMARKKTQEIGLYTPPCYRNANYKTLQELEVIKKIMIKYLGFDGYYIARDGSTVTWNSTIKFDANSLERNSDGSLKKVVQGKSTIYFYNLDSSVFVGDLLNNVRALNKAAYNKRNKLSQLLFFSKQKSPILDIREFAEQDVINDKYSPDMVPFSPVLKKLVDPAYDTCSASSGKAMLLLAGCAAVYYLLQNTNISASLHFSSTASSTSAAKSVQSTVTAAVVKKPEATKDIVRSIFTWFKK